MKLNHMDEWPVVEKDGRLARVGSRLWLGAKTRTRARACNACALTDALYVSNEMFQSSKSVVAVLSLANCMDGIRNKKYLT